MASPAVLTVLLLLLLAPITVAAFEEYVDADGGFLLLDCGHSSSSDSRVATTTAPPPRSAAPPPTSGLPLGPENISIADVRDMLGALPSAAASRGFGVLQSRGGGASVRGVCVGDAASPADCAACLAAAARNITATCGDALAAAGTRRAGAWTDACSVAYFADAAEASASASDDDRRRALCGGDFASSVLDSRGDDLPVFGAWLPDWTFARLGYEVAELAAAEPARMHAAGGARAGRYYPGVAVRTVAQCARDRGAEECLRCLRGSTWQAALSCPAVGTGWVQGARVLSYGCYLRFEVTFDPAAVAGSAAAVVACGAFLRWIVVAFGALVAVSVV